MARDLLSGRERSNQILEAKSKMSLLSGVVVPEPSVIEALSRGDGAAAVALFSGPSKDPIKTKRVFDPSAIPRDAQGRVSEWVPGMANCPCGRPKCIKWMRLSAEAREPKCGLLYRIIRSNALDCHARSRITTLRSDAAKERRVPQTRRRMTALG